MREDNFFKWGAKPVLVLPQVARLLSGIKDPTIKDLLWRSATQGVGDAPASKGTHKKGECVDFSFRRQGWDARTALHVAHALRDNFAVAFRAAGEAGPTAHLHIALLGHANSARILAAERSGNTIRRQIARCFPQTAFAMDEADESEQLATV